MWAAPAHLLFKNGNKVAVIQRILYIHSVLFTDGNSYAKVEKWIFDLWFSGNPYKFGINSNDFPSTKQILQII